MPIYIFSKHFFSFNFREPCHNHDLDPVSEPHSMFVVGEHL